MFDDDPSLDSRDNRARDALLTMLIVLIGGLLLIVVADRVLDLGPTAGNILFVALPLVAGLAASSRFRRYH